jgi:hypothetical protein
MADDFTSPPKEDVPLKSIFPGFKLAIIGSGGNHANHYTAEDDRWNDVDRENRRTRRKTCPSATLSTANNALRELGP